MIITAEISYYPLTGNFNQPIDEFLQKIKQEEITIKTGTMSTLISGEYSIVMKLLTTAMKDLMEQYPSVFNLKIANSCMI